MINEKELYEALKETTYEEKMERLEKICEEQDLEMFNNPNEVRSIEQQLNDIDQALNNEEFKDIKEILESEKEFLQKYNVKNEYEDFRYYVITMLDGSLNSLLWDVVITDTFHYVDKIGIS